MKNKIMLISMANGSDHQRYVRVLANGLKDEYDVDVVCSQYTSAELKKVNGIKVYEVCTPHKSRISFNMISPVAMWKLSRFLRRERPGIIHYMNAHPYNIIINMLSGMNKKIFSLHDVVPHPDENINAFIKIYNYIVKNISDRLVVYSQNSFMQLGKKKSKTSILPLCGRDYERHDDDDGYILFFGRFKPYKGLDMLSKVIEKVDDYKIKFIIAGSGEKSDYNFKFENVKVINRYMSNEELYKLIERCRAVILPYTSASQSGVIPLAYSFGKPIIITNIGGLMDMFIEGSGYISDVNEDDIAEKVRRMCYDNEQYSKFKNNIANMYNELYSKEKMIEKFKKFYKEIIVNEMSIYR